ncbi:retrovirus-related pol polyprotein from transposon TNT 1-94 [Tanacetum coccineum]
MTESLFVDSVFAVPVFFPGDDPIACLNKAMAFLTAVASSRLQGILAVMSVNHPHKAAFQTGDLDTYDSDCDDILTTQAVLMANISNYGSDIISEVPNSETYLNDMDNQSVHALQDFEQSPVMDFTDNEISSDSNIIPYSQYLQETQQALLRDIDFGRSISNPTIESSNIPPVKVEVPSELPKASLVNASLKKLKFHLAQFDSVVKKKTTPDARTEEFFENNDLKAQLQDKDSTICKLKDIIKSMREKSKEENVKYDYGDIESKNVFKEQFDSIKKTRIRTKEQSDSLIDKLNLKSAKNEDLKAQIQDKVFVITSLKNDLRKVKGKEIVDIAAQIPSANTIVPGMFKLDLEPLAPRLLQNREAHIDYLKYTQEQADILQEIVEQAKAKQPLEKELDFAVIQIVLWYLDSGCSKHMTVNRSQLMNFICKFMGTVRFENDHIARIMGYGDYKLGNATISRVYYVEGLGHNLFSVGSRDTNLYKISLDDMLKTSPIYLLSKASKTKSWLWHRRLSHINFVTLNKLHKDGLARGIPILKFLKDHLCSACALGKSKKYSHQPKAEDTNQEKLYLLHMDLCDPMRVASINGKRYILVIVNDYS